MDEQQLNAETQETMEDALSNTLLDFQKKYEDEKMAREAAEKKVVDMTRLLRNMSVTNDLSANKEEEEETLESALNKIFN